MKQTIKERRNNKEYLKRNKNNKVIRCPKEDQI